MGVAELGGGGNAALIDGVLDVAVRSKGVDKEAVEEGGAAVITGVGGEVNDGVGSAGGALDGAEGEGAGADGVAVKGGFKEVGFGCLVEGVFGEDLEDEMLGEGGGAGAEGEFDSVVVDFCDLGTGPTGGADGADFGVLDHLDSENDIVGGERVAVVEVDAFAEGDSPDVGGIVAGPAGGDVAADVAGIVVE